jgi:hypothetical protein
MPVCTASGIRSKPAIAADGSGGAVVAWADRRSGVGYDVYAQRLSAAGPVMWTTNGVPVSAASGDQFAPRLVADGIGGYVFAWIDQRWGTLDIYAERLSGSGASEWTPIGIPVATGAGHRYPPLLAADGTGGVIVVWPWETMSTSHDLVAQRLSSLGEYMWPLPSALVGGGPTRQTFFSHGGDDPNYRALMPDGNGGAIVVFEDYCGINQEDIYAQRLRSDGTLGGTVLGVDDHAAPAGLSVAPNPARGSVTFVATSTGVGGRIEVLDLAGRPVRVFAPSRTVRWDGGSDGGALAAPGVYWVRHVDGERVSKRRFVWLR